MVKKIKATYFSVFFLGCFLASFAVNTAIQYNSAPTDFHFSHSNQLSFTNKSDQSSNNINFLFEENENETEDGFQLQAFTLPFFISYYQFLITKTKPVFAKHIAINTTNPIYLSVCNFRI